MGSALLAAALTACTPLTEAPSCAPSVAVRAFPDGTELARVPLPDDRRFALSFIHSVSMTPVRDNYVVEADGAIRQTSEIFIAHGQGLPSSPAEPGGTGWVHEDGKFRLDMDRPISRLVVRTDARYRNRLHLGAETLNLNHWPDQALDIRPIVCSAPAQPHSPGP